MIKILIEISGEYEYVEDGKEATYISSIFVP